MKITNNYLYNKETYFFFWLHKSSPVRIDQKHKDMHRFCSRGAYDAAGKTRLTVLQGLGDDEGATGGRVCAAQEPISGTRLELRKFK